MCSARSYEAEKLAGVVIRSKGLPLTYVLISHGHTDHFTGMDVFHREFPRAKIVAATEGIKRDIKSYAIYMDSGGETGAEPRARAGVALQNQASIPADSTMKTTSRCCPATR